MRKLVALALIAFSIFTTSCNGLTKKLWNWHGYEEDFKHFLINQQNGYVVFLAQKFHYVFIDNSNLMKNILLWKDRRTLYIDTSATEIHINKKLKIDHLVIIEVSVTKCFRLKHNAFLFYDLVYLMEMLKRKFLKIN